MATGETSAGPSAIRPFTVEIPEAELEGLRTRIGDALALLEARRRSVGAGAAGDVPGARPLLGDRVRLARVRGETERAAAVHHRDRRGRDPLHPRQVAHENRAAADHDACMARLRHRAAGDRRPAHRLSLTAAAPRTLSTWCCRPCLATGSPLSRPSSAGTPAAPARSVGGAQACAARLHPLRRPGRRRGCPRHGPDGPPGGRGFGRLPPEPADGGARNRRSTACGIRKANARRPRRSRRSGRTASATSSRWQPGRRRSATSCWIHRSRWRPGCSTTTRTATTRSAVFVDGEPVGNLTRDTIVDNITLYWLTGTGAVSAARSYWEDARKRYAALASGQGSPAAVTVPVGFTTFPGEIWASPRSRVEAVYPGLPTSTRSTGAGTSPPGRSRSCSALRSARPSGPCAGIVRHARARPRSAGQPGGSTPNRSAPPSCAGNVVLVNFFDLDLHQLAAPGALGGAAWAAPTRTRACG